jgi:hypothetical protein
MSHPKRLARIAGALYLIVGICGGFAEGVVEPRMYAAGNAAAMAGNVVANAGLVRLGIVADLVDQVVFIFLALTLYSLLQHLGPSAARAMVVLVAVAAGVTSLNAVFELEGLRVATGAISLGTGSTASTQGMVLLLLDAQHYGILVAQIFFGLWLVPLGYLAYRSSGLFPRWLGALLILGGACYLVDVGALLLVPDVGRAIAGLVVIPSALAELCMVGYLLVFGVRNVKTVETPAERVAAAA